MNNTTVSSQELVIPDEPGYNPGSGLVAFQTVILSFICLASIVGNTIVINVIFRDYRLHLPTFYFVVNLAVADILTSSTYIPLYIVAIVSQRWVLGETLCKAHVFVISTGINTSLLTLSFISIDRFLDIVFPLIYPNMMTSRRMRVMIVLGWLHSIFWALCPWAFQWGKYRYDEYSSTCRPMYDAKGLVNESYVACMVTVCFTLPTVIMIYCYVRIFSIVEKHVRDIEQISCSVASLASIDASAVETSPKLSPKNQLTVEQPMHVHQEVRKPKELRAHKMILIIILMFMICWAPYAIVAMVRMVSKKSWGPYWSVNGSLTLALLNTAVNPLIYASRDRRFKRGIKKIIWPIFSNFLKPNHSKTLSKHISESV